jgi:hypothetical protein
MHRWSLEVTAIHRRSLLPLTILNTTADRRGEGQKRRGEGEEEEDS